MSNPRRLSVSPVELSERILTIRGHKVMLDSQLAQLYGVSTRRFNEAVRRNLKRFPADFMFTLTRDEVRDLGSATSTDSRHGGRRKLPRVFTEHGAIMAASILNSDAAIEVSMYVVRAFVAMRATYAGQREVSQRLDELEGRLEKKLATHDRAIAEILSAIRRMMNLPESSGRPIGFVTPDS